MTRAAVAAVLACVLCALAGATAAPVQAQAVGDVVAEFRRTAPADADSARAALRQLLLQAIARLEASEMSLLDANAPADSAAAQRAADAAQHPAPAQRAADAAEHEVAANDVMAARRDLVALLDTIVLRTAWGADELRNLRRRYPASSVFLRYEAALAARDGRFGDALAAWDRLLSQRPADAALLRLRGDALLQLGHGEGAAAAYTRAFELEPTDTAGFGALLRLRREDGTLPQLLEQVRRLRLLHPDEVLLAEYETELLHRLGRHRDETTAATTPHMEHS
jgi:tetratricopeptide (TPR) repeat protein